MADHNSQVELSIEPTTWDAVGRALLRGDTDIGVAPARLPDAELHRGGHASEQERSRKRER